MTTGDLTVDFSQHLVTLAGKEIPLTPTEYRILAYLAQNVGRVVTQDLLLEHVWGYTYGDTSTVTVHIRRLREKIEDDPSAPRRITTVWGVGYRFDP